MSLRFLLSATLLLGCGEPSSSEATPMPVPERTAAQDAALRRMVMDMAQHRACAELEGRFVPIPEWPLPEGRRPDAVGRMWISDCSVERDDDSVAIRLSGRGWQWVDESGAGPLGTRYDVRGTVRLESRVALDATADLRYDAATRRANVALTPTSPPSASVTLLGNLPLSSSGAWSGVVGGLGGLLGMSPAAEARDQFGARAEGRLRALLGRGLTVSLDLCSGQLDPLIGPLGDGEPPPPAAFDEPGWLDNATVVLHPSAIDIAGPFASDASGLTVEVERISGSAPRATVVCADDAGEIASAFLASGTAPSTASSRAVADRIAIPLAPGECPRPHLVLYGPSSGVARVRYRARERTPRVDALIDCP
ncbi:MAG: hypothetical protein AB7S26_35315 [Sandaracinaceae bacterium]